MNITTKNDISHYADAELSDNFLNDEFLYDAIRATRSCEEAKELADEHFIYNSGQLNEFMDDYVAGDVFNG